jgi:hypothetical protein
MTPVQLLALREPLTAMLARAASPPPEDEAGRRMLDLIFVGELDDEVVVDLSTRSWDYPEKFDQWREGVLKVTADVLVTLKNGAPVENAYKVLEGYARRMHKDLGTDAETIFARPVDGWFKTEDGWTVCTSEPFAAVVQVAGAYCAWLKTQRVRTELVRSPGPIVAGFLDTLAPSSLPRAADTAMVVRATDKTFPFIDTVQALTPSGHQLPLTPEPVSDGANSLSRILSDTHLRTYLLTLCALYDQEKPNLFFEFNPREIAREYLMKPGEERGLERKAEDLRKSMKVLTHILIVKAGTYSIENGVPQALVQHISGGGRHLYSHPALMHAALTGQGLVQTPRAAYRNLDPRNLPVAVALSVLIRNRLSELRKKDAIRVTPRELVDACGRAARAAVTSLSDQVGLITTLAEVSEVAKLHLEGDTVVIDPTDVLREAYESTMAAPARYAARASRRKAGASAGAKPAAAQAEKKL